MGPKWLNLAQSSFDGDMIYKLDDIKFKTKQLPRESVLVLNPEGDSVLNFAVLGFHASNIDDTEKEMYMIFHGFGTLAPLRECRHTWWGHEGYLFYVKGDVIAAAFKELSVYFDEMI